MPLVFDAAGEVCGRLDRAARRLRDRAERAGIAGGRACELRRIDAARHLVYGTDDDRRRANEATIAHRAHGRDADAWPLEDLELHVRDARAPRRKRDLDGDDDLV